MEMPKYILPILRTQLTIVWSWGAHSFVAKDENTLSFRVNGYLHKGIVEVSYCIGSDDFSVILRKSDGSIKTKEDGIYFDVLVNVIDGMVEHCPNYEKRVAQEYGF